MPFREASFKFDVPESTLRQYSIQHSWKVTAEIVKQARAIVKSKRELANLAAEQAVSTWAARGERHRKRIMDIAEASLKNIKKVPVKSARDLETIDKAGRRAAGLEVADTVNQTLIQVNEAINQHAEAEPIEAELVDDPAALLP